MIYPESKDWDLTKIEQAIQQFWDAEDIFKKSVDERDPNNSFVFYEGPPSANGKPGIHHVMARTVKDLFCRFQTLKGKRVLRRGGWDTHGLPIEISVEKELGITKEDIGKSISVDEYNQKCRETVLRYKDLWDDITRKMGYWVDLEQPYITFKNEYIESVWWLLSQLYQKGFLYKGYTIQPFSPAAGTGLSSHELNQPGTYKDVKDTTVVGQFKLKQDEQSQFLFDLSEGKDVHCIAWTTTPWTLPSNTALAVGKKIDYVLVRSFNPYTHDEVHVVLAEALVGKWFKAEGAELSLDNYEAEQKVIPYRIIKSFKGAELADIRYEQLLPFAQPEEGDAFRVLLGDFVSTEDGTGIVHLAPSFGADDKRVADANGIGALTLVDKQGKFLDDLDFLSGRYVKNYKDDENYKSIDIDIAIELKKTNKAFNVQKYSHNYPHCWRTDKPILYYPLDSWFIEVTKVKDRLVELNKTINWKPSHTGEKRFGNWLENLQDWNLSRSRYWGIPLPIWRTADGSQEVCIGSIAELGEKINQANAALGLNQAVPEDLHRPYIDDVILATVGGEEMRRELDLIDVWFDSGSMPYAQWHYPFENKEAFQQNFPADFIAEGVDQTRGWFYTLHAIATMVFDSVAYKNVVSNGLVQDKHGQKMSKRLGNAVEPFSTIEKYSADATRWYMISNAQPWDNLKFDIKGIEEVRRKFFGTLYHTYSFFALYANIDGYDGSTTDQEIAHADKPEIDRWILSQLQTLIKDVDDCLTDFEPTNAARKIQEFVDDYLSNWYVRLSRRRFWKGSFTADKKAAYQTLHICLKTVSVLMSPIAPFFSDYLYQNLTKNTMQRGALSVHLADFPKVDDAIVNKELEQRMQYAQKISSLILSLRKKEKIRVRQPLLRALIPIHSKAFQTSVEAVKDLILAEVNMKDLEFIKEDDPILHKTIKPNFKTLGRRMGKNMKAAQQLILAFDQDQINAIEKTGQFQLEIEGTSFDLTAEDVEIVPSDIPGWTVAAEGNITVALDTTLTDELLAEGMAKELINRIQNLRKDKGFEVTDHIVVTLSGHEAITAALGQYGDLISAETLADQIFTSEDQLADNLELPGDINVGITIAKS